MDERGEDNTIEIDSLRRELREMEENRARKIIFRAKANWALYGERPSKYFLNLEKRKKLWIALGELNLNKAPGSDGLPPEFYVKFWQQFVPYFSDSLHHAVQIGHPSNSQRRGVITLIPKKDLDRRHMSNWRPS